MIPGVAAAVGIKTVQGGSIAAGTWTLVGIAMSAAVAICTAIIKQWGPWKVAEMTGREADFARLRADIELIKVEAREARNEARRLSNMREVERVRHEAEMAIMRHRANNADACLDALLLLLKTSPSKVDDAVMHIEAMRERQKEEIALEKGAQVGAREALARESEL